MKTLKIKIAITCVALATASMIGTSCSSLSKTQKGAVIGSAAGGTLGALIGKKAGNTAVGAIIGGAIGGTAGAFIGRKMDRQAEEIRKTVPGAEVISADEGLIVKFDSGILFDTNKSDLKSNAMTNIANLATTMKNNPETNILVIGHTDGDGTDAYNQTLSEARANAVRNYAVTQGIAGARLTTVGKGESEPIGDNTTAAGKAQNRRVEIVIVANDQLKQEAKASAGQ
ncbi:OmpA family protein [Hufsiella ginkgonis]|nr:OmpA family protein [Hufsiella ginkgonis]